MRFCTTCGKENVSGQNNFCVYCGAKIEVDSSQSPQTLPVHGPTPVPMPSPTYASVHGQVASSMHEPGPAPRTMPAPTAAPVHGQAPTHASAPVPARTPTAAPGHAPAHTPVHTHAPAPVPKAKEKKRMRGGVIALIVVLLVLLPVLGGGFIFVTIYGADRLPVIGQYFEADNNTGGQKEIEVIPTEKLDEPSSEERSSSRTTQPSEVATQPDESEEHDEEKLTESTEEQASDSPQIATSSGSSQVTASSELPGHPASNIVDGKNDTAWGVEIDDSVINSISIPFGSPITIYGISLKNGNWLSQYDLIRNSRVKELIVEFDDGRREVLPLEDSTRMDYANMIASEGEQLPFQRPHTTTTLRLIISDVYLGAEDAVFITGVTMSLIPLSAYTTEVTTTSAAVEAITSLAFSGELTTLPSPNPDAPTTWPAVGTTTQEQRSSTTQGNSSDNRDYILSHSSTRALTDNDLQWLTKEELWLARNEIFARYGRQFNDKTLQSYFNSKSWYTRLPKLPAGTEPTLTNLEIANIDLIKVYEAK